MRAPKTALWLPILAMIAWTSDSALGQEPGEPGQRGGQRGAGFFERMLKEMDADGDGKLALAEVPEEMQGRFQRMDADGDGFITESDITAMRERMREGRGGRGERGEGRRGRRGRMNPEEMLERFDADGDGNLSRDEFRGPERFFDRLDSDGDGVVTPTELAERAERGGGRGPDARPGGGDEPGEPGERRRRRVRVDPSQILAALGWKGVAGASEEQILELRKGYLRLDASGDAFLNRDEFAGSGTFADAEAIASAFRAADWDGDAKVTVKEYIDDHIVSAEAVEVFARLDANGDGGVTFEELEASAADGDLQIMERIFRRMDADRDGSAKLPEATSAIGRWAREAARPPEEREGQQRRRRGDRDPEGEPGAPPPPEKKGDEADDDWF